MVPLEIVELQQWVIDVKKAQQSKRKWEEPVTKVEDVKRMNDMAKRKVA